MGRRSTLHRRPEWADATTANGAGDRARACGVGYSAPRRAGAPYVAAVGTAAMPPSDDDTDPSETAAPTAVERSDAATASAPRARVDTARGLGAVPAAAPAPAPQEYKAPSAYSSNEIEDLLGKYVRARPAFRPVETPFSNGLRSAAYAGEAPVVHGGVDTLPPDDGVIVSIPKEGGTTAATAGQHDR